MKFLVAISTLVLSLTVNATETTKFSALHLVMIFTLQS